MTASNQNRSQAAEAAEDKQLDADFSGQSYARIDQSIAMGALFTAYHLGCKAIVALTDSGSTALWMSRHRIHTPIYGLTSQATSERIAEEVLALLADDVVYLDAPAQACQPGNPVDPSRLDPVDADLYRAGMTSHASVNVMLGLEDEFDIEFPEERLTKATFTSVQSITEAVEAIQND